MQDQSERHDPDSNDQQITRVEKSTLSTISPRGLDETQTSLVKRDSLGNRIKSILLVLWSQWFLFMCLFAIVLAYLVPNVAKRGGYLKTQYTFAYGALALIFLIAGLTIPTPALWKNLGKWKMHLVTHGMCFLVEPLVGLTIVECIVASGDKSIPQLVMTGIIVTLCTPTTVASNVTFTRMSGGDDAAALVEVTVGNLLGIFISAALVQLLIRPSLGLGQGAPTRGVGPIYVGLIQHFGLALYLPLFVGQVIRNIWTEKVMKFSKMVYLPKWATICLILMFWQTFSDAFATGAFQAISTQAVILLVFLNLTLYPFFTLLCFLLSKPPKRLARYSYLTDGQVVAVCFCGPTKSMVVGLVLIYIQYSDFTVLEQAIITLPLAIYQGVQIIIAQGFVIFFKRWLTEQTRIKEEENSTEEENTRIPDP